MISHLFLRLTNRRPGLRRFFWKQLYEFLAWYYRGGDWQFMNFGYQSTAGDTQEAELQHDDASNRYGIQLYHHLLSQTPLTGKYLLEIGSGRGGGLSFAFRHFKPASATGLDLATKAVHIANREYGQPGLEYVQGDATQLPFEDGSFDVIVNVESSHAYPSFEKFMSEVKRVLRPGGVFLTADNRIAEQVADWDHQLKASGLTLIREQDITDNVLAALDGDEERKEAFIQRNAIKPLRKYIRQFAGMKGSVMYNDFSERRRIYKSYTLVKA